MYVFTYIYMYVYINRSIRDAQLSVSLNEEYKRIESFKKTIKRYCHTYIYICMYVCMYVFTYIYMYVYINRSIRDAQLSVSLNEEYKRIESFINI
jgi:virulence-associated protein VapD